METEKKPVQLNLRNQEIDAILGKSPNWLMRSGITSLFLIFITLLVISAYFRYPDVVNAKIVISSEYQSVAMVAKFSGKIKHILVREDEIVEKNRILGVMESSASFDDVASLSEWMSKSPAASIYPDDTIFKQELQLGEIMPYFLELKTSVAELKKFRVLSYHTQSIASLKEQIVNMRQYIEHSAAQIRLLRDELQLVEKEHDRDSVLYKNNVMSVSEIEQAKRSLLQKKYTLEGNMASLANSKSQLSQLEQSLLEKETDFRIQEQNHADNIRRNLDALRDRLEQWDIFYVFRAPYAGKISIPAFWVKDRYITQGDVFVNIIPSVEGSFMGKVELPALNSGKVNIGQEVNIKLDNYPYMEYGILKGYIQSISAIPNNNMYRVVVSFPYNLRTSYGIELPFSPEMTGAAEIITEDFSLMQRLLFPVKSLLVVVNK